MSKQNKALVCLTRKPRLKLPRTGGMSCQIPCPLPFNCTSACQAWIPWNLSFRYILFHEKWLQTMLWHHNTRVNSHQRWKQTLYCLLLCVATCVIKPAFFSTEKDRKYDWLPDTPQCDKPSLLLNNQLGKCSFALWKSMDDNVRGKCHGCVLYRNFSS